MPISDDVADRSVEAARRRAEQEVRALVDAGLAVMQRSGAAALTVADVLEEAGLSTRAFYRHFRSKDELVLAVFEHEQQRSLDRLQIRVRDALERSPRAALDAWVDETLALGFNPRRAARTVAMWQEGARLRGRFPVEFDTVLDALLAPLTRVLSRGRDDGSFPTADPSCDAGTIHAIAWRLVERRLAGDTALDLAGARAHVLRFALAAIGADSAT